LKGREKILSNYRKPFNSRYSAITLNNNFTESSFIPIPWRIWPYEGKILFFLLFIWSVFGLIMLGSASWWVASKELGDWAYYINRQLIWYGPGLGLFLIILQTKIRNLLKISKFIFFVLLILVTATVFFGSTVNGSSRWLIIGPLQMQPSELIKPFAVLEAANLFAYWELVSRDKKITSLIKFGTLIFFIMLQPNLSTAGLIGILFWVMAFCGGVKIRTLGLVAALGALSGYLSVLKNEYQRIRITSFINPWDDPQGYGYQLIQSLLAIGSGGVWGQGFGLSTQKLQYLPIQSTDFIYAIFAEEFGLIGSTFLISFLVMFAYVSLRIAIKCRNNYTKLVATGSATILIFQSILHIAVTTGSMPTTGLPFPLVSYGGNSLISSLLIAGLLLRCSLESTGIIGLLETRKKKIR